MSTEHRMREAFDAEHTAGMTASQQGDTDMGKLTLGTAKIFPLRDGRFVVKWMGTTSVHDNERMCGSEPAAREFCRENGLRVL